MNTFTADSNLGQSLSNLPGLTEVRDSHGLLLGYFSPTSNKTPELYVEAAAHFDPEELKQRKLSNETGRSTNEVLKRIAASEE